MPKDDKNTIQNAIPSDAEIASFDPVKSALANKYLQNDINLGSGVAGRVELVGDTLTEAFLNYLKNSVPDVKYIKSSAGTMQPYVDPTEASKNISNLKSAIQNLDPKYRQLAQTYLDSIDTWTLSKANNLRNALNNANASGDKLLAEHLQNLVQSSDYRSTSPLFRGSSLGEIPNLQVGETFENPFMSFTSNRNAAGDFSLRNKMMLESGARTLPVMGISNVGNEFEHIVGGKFGIQDILENALGKIVKIRQLDQ